MNNIGYQQHRIFYALLIEGCIDHRYLWFPLFLNFWEVG